MTTIVATTMAVYVFIWDLSDGVRTDRDVWNMAERVAMLNEVNAPVPHSNCDTTRVCLFGSLSSAVSARRLNQPDSSNCAQHCARTPPNRPKPKQGSVAHHRCRRRFSDQSHEPGAIRSSTRQKEKGPPRATWADSLSPADVCDAFTFAEAEDFLHVNAQRLRLLFAVGRRRTD